MVELSEPVSIRVHYMLALVRALAANEGGMRPGMAYAWIEMNGERRHHVPARDVDPDMHFQRELRFARQELADGGILASTDGMWRLADADLGAAMSAEDARCIIRDNRRRREQRREGATERVSGADRPIRPQGPTTGPRPSQWKGMIVREDGPASTYALRFGTSDLWKIGFASNVDDRLAQVNQHVPVELLGDGWRLELRLDWPNQEMAYAMEQEVLLRLFDQRTMFERVSCSRERLESAWEGGCVAVRKSFAVPAPLKMQEKVSVTPLGASVTPLGAGE